MKKNSKYILAILLFCSINSVAFAQKTTINGKAEGGYTTAYLLKGAQNQNQIIIDSAKIDKTGNFKISTQITEPDFFFLQLASGDNKPIISIVLFPKQTISVEIEKQTNTIAYKSVKGSEDIQQIKDVFGILNASNERLAYLRDEYQKADDKQKIEQEYNQIVTTLFTQINTKILAKKELLANAMLVGILDFDGYFDTYKTIAKTLSEKYPKNTTVQGIAQQVTQAGTTRVGVEAPEIELPNLQGKNIKLSSLRGKYVLIDFWASWCGPCRKENPHVVALYKKYNSKGFDIFSVSLDKDKNAWQNAINSDGLIWENHVSDLKAWGSAAASLYGVRGIPYTVLIDKEGKIISIGLRGDALSQKLAELLGE